MQSTETMLDSQTSLSTKFETGSVKHNLIAGIELMRETSSPVRTTYTGVPTADLMNPSPNQPFAGTGSISTNVNTVAQTQAVFFNDTISPHEKFDIVLGGRIDRFTADYTEAVSNSSFSRTDIMPAVRSSFVYKPRKDSSVYANYGTSYNPSAEAFALTATTQNVKPEMNETFEIGTKWGFFKNKLNTMFAVFQTKKTDARVTDPLNSLLTVNGGNQMVKGFETQINGEITEKLQVFSSYAYMESEVISSTNANQVGNPLANVPNHTLNLWGSYKLTPKFEFGGGANAISQRVASITAFDSTGGTISGSTAGSLKKVDGYITFNAMAKYQFTPKISMQLNIYNLTNEFYYDQLHPSHVIPGVGRTLLLTTNIKLD
jgi:catecholate siderophore receptor